MTFREYLMDKYIRIEHPIDDMISDGFPEWLENSDIEDILDWADLYAEEKALQSQRRIIKEISDSMPNLEEELK